MPRTPTTRAVKREPAPYSMPESSSARTGLALSRGPAGPVYKTEALKLYGLHSKDLHSIEPIAVDLNPRGEGFTMQFNHCDAHLLSMHINLALGPLSPAPCGPLAKISGAVIVRNEAMTEYALTDTQINSIMPVYSALNRHRNFTKYYNLSEIKDFSKKKEAGVAAGAAAVLATAREYKRSQDYLKLIALRNLLLPKVERD